MQETSTAVAVDDRIRSALQAHAASTRADMARALNRHAAPGASDAWDAVHGTSADAMASGVLSPRGRCAQSSRAAVARPAAGLSTIAQPVPSTHASPARLSSSPGRRTASLRQSLNLPMQTNASTPAAQASKPMSSPHTQHAWQGMQRDQGRQQAHALQTSQPNKCSVHSSLHVFSRRAQPAASSPGKQPAAYAQASQLNLSPARQASSSHQSANLVSKRASDSVRQGTRQAAPAAQDLPARARSASPASPRRVQDPAGAPWLSPGRSASRSPVRSPARRSAATAPAAADAHHGSRSSQKTVTFAGPALIHEGSLASPCASLASLHQAHAQHAGSTGGAAAAAAGRAAAEPAPAGQHGDRCLRCGVHAPPGTCP